MSACTSVEPGTTDVRREEQVGDLPAGAASDVRAVELHIAAVARQVAVVG